MTRFLRRLNPNTGLRGLMFGYLFGFVWFCVVYVLLEARSPTFSVTPGEAGRCLRLGLVFAIPWAFLWGLSGVACRLIPGHLGTLSTLLALTGATAHYFHYYTVGGWLPLVVIFHTCVAFIPCHLVGLVVAVLLDSRFQKFVR